MKGMGYGDDTGVLVGCEGGMHGMERKEICEELMQSGRVVVGVTGRIFR